MHNQRPGQEAVEDAFDRRALAFSREDPRGHDRLLERLLAGVGFGRQFAGQQGGKRRPIHLHETVEGDRGQGKAAGLDQQPVAGLEGCVASAGEAELRVAAVMARKCDQGVDIAGLERGGVGLGRRH